MTVKNDNIVHYMDSEDVEEAHPLNHCALSHAHYLEKRGSWRKHAFNVILPRKFSEHTDSDLQLMLVSLKNTTIAVSVHISRIERELKNRECNLTVLGGR